MKNIEVLLETTVQADRIVGTIKRKEAIAFNLRDKALFSSTIVLGEFKQTFVHDAVIFYNLLLDSPTTNEALKRLQAYRERVHKRAVAIFASVTENGSMDKNDVLDNLERWIEWELEYRFNRGLVSILDLTKCTMAKSFAVKEDDVYRIDGLGCSKEHNPDCGIKEFLDTYNTELKDIVVLMTQLEVKDKEQTQMVEISKRVLEGESCFGRNCQVLKDIIITLETPKQVFLYTTNHRHFYPICNAIGKNLYKELAYH